MNKVVLLAAIGFMVGAATSVAMAAPSTFPVAVMADGSNVVLECPTDFINEEEILRDGSPANPNDRFNPNGLKDPPPGLTKATGSDSVFTIDRRDGIAQFVAETDGQGVFNRFIWCEGEPGPDELFPVDIDEELVNGAFINEEGVLTDG